MSRYFFDRYTEFQGDYIPMKEEEFENYTIRLIRGWVQIKGNTFTTTGKKIYAVVSIPTNEDDEQGFSSYFTTKIEAVRNFKKRI